MAWQDIVLSVGSWIFVIALIPAIRAKEKPPLATSLMTGVILVVYVFTYASLSLWLSVFSTGLVAAAWLVLAGQRYMTSRKNRSDSAIIEKRSN
ncbi:MAG: hypothetical protein A2751_00750 [Candidatus Doudnabacteria bacterium RIFCSPHIGHO2_01_FULL_46_14]|uniref:Uncharacterized protein n=1 Tax=Candidatus Doudnabacteria bacterium RIFCSPHIGHO2_01_FULL_46_14 TaxID=1817824 RepID=A0A1F5NMX4_9BACT|nr:MAG: hypothetical protein A2751_00750 [Candidatus Doudnabacteria bacterium RIFCSPHIGHO2_01_FULL_46_14]